MLISEECLKKYCTLYIQLLIDQGYFTHHMLLPGLLGSSRLQLLQVPQLTIQLIHPVGLSLVAHVILL